jgi:hypothetical protein
MASSLVVIDEPDVPGGAFAPFEACPPLIIDADAVLPVVFAEQRFGAIGRWNAQVVNSSGGEKLGPRAALKSRSEFS